MKCIAGFLFGFLFLLNSCGENKKPSNDIEKINFSVDSSLLGEKVVLNDLNFSYNAPKNWIIFDSAAVNQLIKIPIEQSKNDISKIIKPINYFVDSITKSILITSMIFDKDKKNKKQFISNYKNHINTVSKDSKVMVNEFMKDNFHIVQFLIQNNDFVNFKLVMFINSNIIQQDFYIPPKEYNMEIAKVIESSIGSMNIINN